ncbi:MAG: hypothetical protein EP344_12605 [Bacteroidetes bacterium]|nr:MAG: hypothetical protein EP344_12605 [Bacteroidota bacterium]
MKIPVAISLVCTLILGLAWSGCKKEEKKDYLADADCSQIDIGANTYTFAVKAVLDGSCATVGCHDATTQENGINFSTYAGAKAAFETKAVLCAINHGDECEPMPKGGVKLPAVSLNILMCWAKNGYPE